MCSNHTASTKCGRGLNARAQDIGHTALQCGFESFRLHQFVRIAQLVEREPLHGEGPKTLAGKTKPMVRVHPRASRFDL